MLNFTVKSIPSVCKMWLMIIWMGFLTFLPDLSLFVGPMQQQSRSPPSSTLEMTVQFFLLWSLNNANTFYIPGIMSSSLSPEVQPDVGCLPLI